VAVFEEQVLYPHLLSLVMEKSTRNEDYALKGDIG
jgi:hypothetical protein